MFSQIGENTPKCFRSIGVFIKNPLLFKKAGDKSKMPIVRWTEYGKLRKYCFLKISEFDDFQ